MTLAKCKQADGSLRSSRFSTRTTEASAELLRCASRGPAPDSVSVVEPESAIENGYLQNKPGTVKVALNMHAKENDERG
jgi:hypothetical protein